MAALWFFIGLFVGGGIGVIMMCLLQINRLNGYEDEIRRLKEQIKTKK